MQIFKTVGLALAGCVMAGSVWAQAQYDGAVSFQYKGLSDEFGGDATGLGVDFDNRLSFGSFFADVDFSRNQLEDNAGDDLTVTTRNITLNYRHSNGLRAGVYSAMDSYDALGTTLDFGSAGLELGHDSRSGVSVTGFVGRSDMEDAVTLLAGRGADLQIDDVGLRFGGVLGAGASFFGSAVQSTLSAPGTTNEVKISTFGLGGTYDVSDGFKLFAAAEQAQSDEIDSEVTTLAFGTSYAAQVSGRPMYLSAEVARTRLADSTGDLDVNRVNVGVTVPLGRTPTQGLPGGTVTQSIADGARTGLTSAFGIARF